VLRIPSGATLEAEAPAPAGRRGNPSGAATDETEI